MASRHGRRRSGRPFGRPSLYGEATLTDRDQQPLQDPPFSGAPRDPSLVDAIGALASALRHDQLAAEQALRRQRRRAWWWRLVAILLVIGVGVGAFLGSASYPSDHIARVRIDGVIQSDPKRDALFAKLAESDDVKAVIVHLDSPGGTTVGGEALFQSMRRIAERKPVVSVMGQVAASAAFLSAIAADHVVARGNTITASVGVIYVAPNVSGLLDRIGVTVTEVASGANKAQPSVYAPVREDALEDERQIVDDSFEWFLDIVRERRAPSTETLALISDGRVVTGRRALELALVDRIGGEEEARDWLAESHGLTRDLSVRDRRVEDRKESILGSLFGGLLGESRTPAALDLLINGPVLSSTRHNWLSTGSKGL